MRVPEAMASSPPVVSPRVGYLSSGSGSGSGSAYLSLNSPSGVIAMPSGGTERRATWRVGASTGEHWFHRLDLEPLGAGTGSPLGWSSPSHLVRRSTAAAVTVVTATSSPVRLSTDQAVVLPPGSSSPTRLYGREDAASGSGAEAGSRRDLRTSFSGMASTENFSDSEGSSFSQEDIGFCAKLVNWLQYRIGKPYQFWLIVSCMVFNAACIELSEQALQHTKANISSLLVANNAASLLVALVASFSLEGRRALPKVFSLAHAWRYTGIAGLFTMSTFLIMQAFKTGATPALVATLGNMYLPISALLSTCFFGRHQRSYGRLEWLSLAIMTLSALGFILLRERSGLNSQAAESSLLSNGTTPSGHGAKTNFGRSIIDTWFHDATVGDRMDNIVAPSDLSKEEAAMQMFFVLLAVCVSACGSILAERIYKGKSLGLSRLDETAHRFAIQKVHMDGASLLAACIIWVAHSGITSSDSDEVFGRAYWFGTWEPINLLMVALSIGQGWSAGLTCKQFSTVVKSIVQTMSTIILFCISDPLLGLHDFRTRAMPAVALAIMLVLAAIIFQTGRINLRILRERQLHNAKASFRSREELAGHGGADASGTLNHIDDEEESEVASVMTGDSSSLGSHITEVRRELRTETRIVLLSLYLLMFVVQQLATQFILSQFPIVNATMNLMQFVFGVAVATFLTGFFNGLGGLRKAWHPQHILKFLPVGILFGLSQSMIFMAYANHVPASIASVLGFIYLPVAAIGKRLVLHQYTTWLQWVALIIITIGSMTFGEMQAQDSIASSGMKYIGLWFVIFSAALSAIASLVSEKFMGKPAPVGKGLGREKEEEEPYHLQKVALDMGSIFMSIAMFFIQGWLSERPMDAFWRDRPLGHCDDPHCWGTLSDLADTCAGEVCSCPCGHGVFINWDSWLVWLTLVVITVRGWLKGQLTKQTSTLEVAITEAFGPICIHFLGQPFIMYIQGQPGIWRSVNDFALNCVVVITPLSAIIYTLAEKRTRLIMQSIDPNRKVEAECCPLDTLLVIVSRLETQDGLRASMTPSTRGEDGTAADLDSEVASHIPHEVAEDHEGLSDI